MRTEQEWYARVQAAIAQGRTEIAEDIASGRVPATVRDFSELHDYVDANEYGGLCDDGWIEYTEDGCEWTPESEAAIHRVQQVLHEWLQAGRPEGGE